MPRAARRKLMRRHLPRVLGFGVSTQLCFLVPLGAVAMMPAAVAGSTRPRPFAAGCLLRTRTSAARGDSRSSIASERGCCLHRRFDDGSLRHDRDRRRRGGPDRRSAADEGRPSRRGARGPRPRRRPVLDRPPLRPRHRPRRILDPRHQRLPRRRGGRGVRHAHRGVHRRRLPARQPPDRLLRSRWTETDGCRRPALHRRHPRRRRHAPGGGCGFGSGCLLPRRDR